ncbi:uncharacterized protein LOC127432056 [Myxocyprinus asiaticus]|uniref:uncharacterized protein LOC127432056 n=1 Tax=Myxocyprinus asiaticus TaxID=70543 RepID=UPI002222CE41|nr:uncharacterized protein LOC127432056 [Myxocyprinus asiaticus]
MRTYAQLVQPYPVEETVEIPVYTRVPEALKTQADTPVEEAVETGITDTASIDQGLSSRALQERALETLDENSAESSGTFITVNGVDDTVEIITAAIKHAVEASFESRQAAVQPREATSYHEELLIESALEASATKPSATMVLSTEPTKEPRVAAPAEHHRLNNDAGVNTHSTVQPAQANQEEESKIIIVNGKTMCSFCKLPIDGHVKITVNIPAICCHPDCFKVHCFNLCLLGAQPAPCCAAV